MTSRSRGWLARSRRLLSAPARLQSGDALSLPHSRPMPGIGKACHELRVNDRDATWRIVYYVDADAIVILEVFSKKTQATPRKVIEACQKRLEMYRRSRG